MSSPPPNTKRKSKRNSFLAFLSPRSSRSSFSHSTTFSTSSLRWRSAPPPPSPLPPPLQRQSKFVEHFSSTSESGSERRSEDRHLELEAAIGYLIPREERAHTKTSLARADSLTSTRLGLHGLEEFGRTFALPGISTNSETGTGDKDGTKTPPTTKKERRKMGVYLPLGPGGKLVLPTASSLSTSPASSRSSRESIRIFHTARSTGLLNSISEEKEDEVEKRYEASAELSSASGSAGSSTSTSGSVMGWVGQGARSAPNSPPHSRSPPRTRARPASALPKVILSSTLSSATRGVPVGAMSAPSSPSSSRSLPRCQARPASSLPEVSTSSSSASITENAMVGARSAPHSHTPSRSPPKSSVRSSSTNSLTPSEQTRFSLPAQNRSTIATESLTPSEQVRFSLPARPSSIASTSKFVTSRDLSAKAVTPKNGNGSIGKDWIICENPGSGSESSRTNAERSSKTKEKRKSTWGKIKHALFGKQTVERGRRMAMSGPTGGYGAERLQNAASTNIPRSGGNPGSAKSVESTNKSAAVKPARQVRQRAEEEKAEPKSATQK
ncbi:hypothetical protein B0J14DRAFT_647674 [Halenospora varia]|nr:hypothetical protein B0J14DRAFT_647674 [Halenospora varia]